MGHFSLRLEQFSRGSTGVRARFQGRSQTCCGSRSSRILLTSQPCAPANFCRDAAFENRLQKRCSDLRCPVACPCCGLLRATCHCGTFCRVCQRCCGTLKMVVPKLDKFWFRATGISQISTTMAKSPPYILEML